MALPDQRQLQTINEIAEALCDVERRRLLFLCESLDTDNSVGSLKAMLKSKVMCYERGDLFLKELMLQLRRFDILRKVFKTSKEELERNLTCRQVLPRFRILMANIGEDLVNEDLDNVKFLLTSTLPREKVEKSKNFLDVIIELEKLDIVSPERVDFVENCLQNIGRLDLAKKVTAYKMSVVTSEQHSSQQQKCRAPRPFPPSNSCHPLQQTRRGQSPHSATGIIPAPVYREQNCQSHLDCYKFNTNPRGVCVIIDCVGNDGDADVFWSHCWTDECQLEQGHHRSIYLKALTDALHKGQRRKTHLVAVHTEVNGAIFEHNKRNPGANYHIDLKHTLRKDLYLQ
ncbi:CASP8 and FADD-like apoptosis regulator isoform X2 [Siniperca chuatsi]|uniref:CASP8 and FADD-like apoptosis regulator isoform X2 n=1 Tax=Siniperca chuatsi TaxID=119488 RepID=UPI001CE1D33C|nr:CASP8 and FADD-like apoptosis regulator isoform X2 [Siniperca chuatsi]